MVARKICDLSVVLVASPKYLKQRGTPKQYADLARHDLLRVKFLNGKLMPWTFRTTGKAQLVPFEGSAKLTISDPEVILDAALLHLGIAALGRYDAHAALRAGTLVEVLPGQLVMENISMSVFYPHRSGLAPRVRAFVDHLLERLAEEESLHDRAGPKKPKR
jgi:DNA-binding transcriptional LysR family regulator